MHVLQNHVYQNKLLASRLILMSQPKSAYLVQTNTNYPHPTTQSGPDSQTARPQARNTASGCNAALSLHHNTGFAI